MKKLSYFLVAFLLSWSIDTTNGFCDKFPYGHICRNMDLTGFCLQISHLLEIERKEARVPPYTHFEKIFQKLRAEVNGELPFVHFGGYKRGKVWPCPEKFERCSPVVPPGPGPAPPGPPPPPPPYKDCPPGPPPPMLPCPSPLFQAGPPPGTDTTDPTYQGCDEKCDCCEVPPDDTLAVGTIFSLQDGCELKYLKAPIESVASAGTLLNPIPPETDAKENPYRLSITEIKLGDVVLHNWLHIKISADGTAGLGSGDFGEGKIKMAFIMAHDAMGFPVGEFVNSIPCQSNCSCVQTNVATDPQCHQGTLDDTIPCMFDGDRVTINTAMMMVYSKFEGVGEGLSEIHGTWRFSQSASPENFITEIHFKALLVDDFDHLKMLAEDATNMNFRLSAMSERRVDKQGMFGWNPVYDILHPTIKTLGAYDYFREDIFDPTEIDCHHPLRPDHYLIEPYPDSGIKIRKLMDTPESEHCYRLNDTFFDDDDSKKPIDNINYCDTSIPAGQKLDRIPVKCPGARSKVEPWFHDAYGYMKNEQINKEQIYPWTLFGARTESYVARDGGIDPDNWESYRSDPEDIKLYLGTDKMENAVAYGECGNNPNDRSDYYGKTHQPQYPKLSDAYDIKVKYGHFCTIDGHGRRVLNFPNISISKWPNTLAELWKFAPVASQSYLDDRCYCPRIPPTPDPRYKEPPEVQVQGRRQHAYQMIIAWNCIVPFAIFVSRYYKETYSKVFFLQEYWWYTIHVLCMWSAAMFTFGGIYVMELKRRDPVNWLDPNITAHVIIGYTVITVFFFQVITGFFRLKDPKKRIFQIFTHWLLGAIEYILAIVCMINASFILLSSMTCEGVVALGFLLLFQVMFYASMEVHMRNVDKLLKLQPPRSYLPPPIMRVFHKDAPDSKFRIEVLLAYFVLCVITSIIQFVSMESNVQGDACFIKSSKYSDSLIQIIE